MSTISEIKEEKDKEGGFYVVEGNTIINIIKIAIKWCIIVNEFILINKTAVELSSESEPEDPADLTELEDIKVDDDDLQDLDKLIATTKSINKIIIEIEFINL